MFERLGLKKSCAEAVAGGSAGFNWGRGRYKKSLHRVYGREGNGEGFEEERGGETG